MNGVTTESTASTTGVDARRGRRRSPGFAALAGLAVGSLVLAACGGDDDDDDTTASTTVTTVAATLAPTTVAPTPVATTAPPPTTEAASPFVTDGAVVIVANSSGIDGAAGRLTDRLAIAGFTTGSATNAADSVGQLTNTEIHYVPGDDDALAVAQSVKTALGGGDGIELVEVGTPAPTESGELGGATVVVLMGNDVADRSLEELQGGVVVDDTTDDATAEDTAEATGEDTTDG